MRTLSINLSAARTFGSAALAAIQFAAPCAWSADEDKAPVETAKPAYNIRELQLFIENDTWAGTDRYYTNGIKFGAGAHVGALKNLLTASSPWMLDFFSLSRSPPEFGLFVGQNMYTPKSITVSTPQPLDRPWAAWLYLGGVVQRVRGSHLDTTEIDIGMVGPAALGEAIQSRWHKLIGAPQPLGWHNQIPNEPAFLIAYLHKRKIELGTEHVEVVPHIGATLGTVMTLARAGGIIRVGQNMTGYGPDSIEPGGAMLQNTRRAEEAKRQAFEWYGFAGADFRLVAHNIFLDGTVFHHSPGVSRNRIVHDLTGGLVARYRHVRFSLTRIRRSEEFAAPPGGGGAQVFHSINIGIEF